MQLQRTWRMWQGRWRGLACDLCINNDGNAAPLALRRLLVELHLI